MAKVQIFETRKIQNDLGITCILKFIFPFFGEEFNLFENIALRPGFESAPFILATF